MMTYILAKGTIATCRKNVFSQHYSTYGSSNYYLSSWIFRLPSEFTPNAFLVNVFSHQYMPPATDSTISGLFD